MGEHRKWRSPFTILSGVLRRELAVVQCGVVAALSQQFLMVSNFLDVPVLHVDDQLRVLDGG